MDTTARLERFVEEKRAERHDGRDVTRLPPGTLPFVTVSSESGAGGRRFVARLLERLENEPSAADAPRAWHAFDKAMCGHLLEREHLAESMGELLDEDYHSQVEEFVLGIFGDRGMQNVAYMRLAKALRTIASLGQVVLPGFGGALATRELAGGIHVRLVAPLPVRAARMAPELGTDERAALDAIDKRDRERRRLLKTHYRVDVADPVAYDIVCNTERVSPETAAGLVLSLLHDQAN